jgi:ABC-type polysaccharide/polyol phosphate export permease
VIALLRSLRSHHALLSGFVWRDLKARYVGSAMGFFWSLVFPIVNLFVFMFVFRLVLKARWGDATPVEITQDGGTRIDMVGLGTGSTKETGLVMLAGILIWSAFAETLSRATNCLVENSNLIQKVVFPSEILPPYLTVSSVVNMLIGLPVVLVGVLVFTDLGLGAPLLLAPVLLGLQLLFTMGLGYFLATLNLYLRDTYHVVGVATTVWMFATPIFYPPQLVETASVQLGNSGRFLHFNWLLEVNPMHWLIDSWRRVLIFNHWPEWDLLLRFGAVSVVVFGLGAWLFMARRREFPDLL